MDEVISFFLDKIPTGVMVFNKLMEISYINRSAENFLKRHKPPEELMTLSRRILDSGEQLTLDQLFPGEIILTRKIEGSLSDWIFKFHIYEEKGPYVIIFIIEEPVSHMVDLNEIRRRFRLTRRETDILRRVLNGLKNVEIAEDLDITEQTVKDHLSNVYGKMGVENRFALARLLLNSPEQ